MVEAVRKIKRSSASLNGGFVVGFFVVVLTYRVTGELGWELPIMWTASVVIGSVMGAWVRIADL